MKQIKELTKNNQNNGNIQIINNNVMRQKPLITRRKVMKKNKTCKCSTLKKVNGEKYFPHYLMSDSTHLLVFSDNLKVSTYSTCISPKSNTNL